MAFTSTIENFDKKEQLLCSLFSSRAVLYSYLWPIKSSYFFSQSYFIFKEVQFLANHIAVYRGLFLANQNNTH